MYTKLNSRGPVQHMWLGGLAAERTRLERRWSSSLEERIMSTRRDFVKMVAGASLAPSVLRASQASNAMAAKTSRLAAKVYLEPFDYQGVRLLDGMLKSQYDRTREYYFKIPNDDILKGFRERAGLPAPGQAMGGWAIESTSGVFGQWISGMAR